MQNLNFETKKHIHVKNDINSVHSSKLHFKTMIFCVFRGRIFSQADNELGASSFPARNELSMLFPYTLFTAGNELGASSFPARNELSMLFPYTLFTAGNELILKLNKNTASDGTIWDCSKPEIC